MNFTLLYILKYVLISISVFCKCLCVFQFYGKIPQGLTPQSFSIVLNFNPVKCIYLYMCKLGISEIHLTFVQCIGVHFAIRVLLMSTNVIPAQPGSRLQNIVGQIWSLHAQLFNTEMPGVAEPPHYVGRTWHMAVFSRAWGQGTTDGKGRTVTGS